MEKQRALVILEKSIKECTHHLKFLKESSSITNDQIEFIETKDFNKPLLNSLVSGSELSNIHCIVTSTELEISIILKSLHYSNHEIESKQIIKNGVLIIYETIKTLDKLGKILIKLSTVYREHNSDFEKYLEGMKNFKKNIKLDSTYKEIRNQIAGHIVSDFSVYSRIINAINIEDQKCNLYQFKMLIDALNTFLFKCFDESNKKTTAV